MTEPPKLIVWTESPKTKRVDRRNDDVPFDSEAAIAGRFVDEHGADFAFCHDSGAWMVYRAGLWSEDRLGVVPNAARQICESVASRCPDIRIARAVASAKTVRGVLQLASAWPEIAVRADAFDPDPWLLNTPDCVIDLRTGEKLAHSADMMMARQTAVPAGGEAPLFKAMLMRITGGDFEFETYLRNMAGYLMTGSTQEHAMFFLFGGGANSKGTFINAVSGALGTYSTTAPIDLFLEQHGESHPTGIASLEGARLVTASETDEGRRWAEARLKQLVAGDKVAARKMRQDFREFVPRFKLVVCGNHKPHLRTVDESIRRRMQILPFLNQIPVEERDLLLGEKLKAEWGGILSWALEGSIDWYVEGLKQPAAVRNATGLYLESEDAMGQWITDCTSETKGHWESSAVLFHSWKGWCERNGEHHGSGKRFNQALQSHGFKPARQGGTGARGFADIVVIRTETLD